MCKKSISEIIKKGQKNYGKFRLTDLEAVKKFIPGRTKTAEPAANCRNQCGYII